jgi:UDP-N-acetylmuramoyl-tripeptide--D-alanyl-D-alanine ligase
MDFLCSFFMKGFFKKIVVAILTAEARILLARKRPKIIAITGSVGKTSTKDAIYSVIKKKAHARKSEKSFNSDIGVPLTVLGLPNAWNNPLRWIQNIIEGLIIAFCQREYPEWLVLEVGVDRPGDMTAITAWMRPDIVVLTRLPDMPVHVEYFGTPEEVVREKLQLVAALKEDGIFVYNNDDERSREVAATLRQKSVGFSRYSLSDFTASADKIMYDSGRAVGIECTLTHGEEAVVLHVEGSLGVQHAYNYAAAAAVGDLLGVTLEDAAAILREHIVPPGRMRLVAGIKDTLIIDDTYNSSPVAVSRALQTLKEVKGATRKIAVMGDMLELGQFSVRAHHDAGRQAAECCDILITVGVRAHGIAKGALDAGMPPEQVFQYDDAYVAGNEVEMMLREADVALVKGSQALRLERIVEEIMQNPEEAPALLVRQDEEWKER